MAIQFKSLAAGRPEYHLTKYDCFTRAAADLWRWPFAALLTSLSERKVGEDHPPTWPSPTTRFARLGVEKCWWIIDARFLCRVCLLHRPCAPSHEAIDRVGVIIGLTCERVFTAICLQNIRSIMFTVLSECLHSCHLSCLFFRNVFFFEAPFVTL